MEAGTILIIVRRSIIYTFLLLVLFFSAGCASFLRIDGPYEGRVIDAETKQPIVGAVAVGEWTKVNVLSGFHEYYDTREVLTDSNGDFKIPGQGLLFFSRIEQMALMIFKAGYKQRTLNRWDGRQEVKEAGFFQKPVFMLKRLTMEERRNSVVESPGGPNKKKRLFIMESNKEQRDLGRGDEYIIPVE